MWPRARVGSASCCPPRAVRGGSAPRLASTSAGSRPWPKKKSAAGDSSTAVCTCARHTSTRRYPRRGAPPGLLVSLRRWSYVSSGGLDGALHDELILDAVRPLEIGLPPCHTHTRTSESTHIGSLNHVTHAAGGRRLSRVCVDLLAAARRECRGRWGRCRPSLGLRLAHGQGQLTLCALRRV